MSLSAFVNVVGTVRPMYIDKKKNIDLNARNDGDDGWTPFMWACWNGRKDVVKLFLDQSKRIELNARDNDGGTAFMLACYNGHKDVVKLLLDYPDLRIDLNAKVPATSTDEASQVPCRTM